MTTNTAVACEPTVHHAQHVDPHLLRVIHGYRPVCPCGFRGALTSDEPAAMCEAARHGSGL